MFPKTATKKRYWCEWWFSMNSRKNPPELGRRRQKDCLEFLASLGDRLKAWLKKKKNLHTRRHASQIVKISIISERLISVTGNCTVYWVIDVTSLHSSACQCELCF